MTVPLRPRLRPVEIIPVKRRGGPWFALRDPEGFGDPVELTSGAVLLASLMNGRHTLAEIQSLFKRQADATVSMADLKALTAQLERAHWLEGVPFEEFRLACLHDYLSDPVRPAAHAGGAYAGKPEALREQLAETFTGPAGPGNVGPAARSNGRKLCGIVSPHIDLHRGGETFAWAYKALVEQSRADLFVIFGTAHNPMDQWFSFTRKDFDTPLGVVKTHQAFIDGLETRLADDPDGRRLDLFEDELAHRLEHSIEFQVVYLQHLLGGKRPFQIVPVLVGSFYQLVQDGRHPDQVPEILAFARAMRAVADEHPGRVCFISGADLAHIGQQFGDEHLLDEDRLAQQAADDRRLLAAACRGDRAGFFQHVADCGDCNRICGLSPTYTLLQVIAPARGKLLRYDQAVEPDATSCVSFASLAFYRR